MDKIRIFLAVKIPKDLQDKVLEIQKQLKKQNPDVKWVEPENFHYNLKFFGHVTGSELNKIQQAVKKVIKKHEPFSIEIAGIGTFPSPTSPRVIWLGTKKGTNEITDLANELDDEFSKSGFEAESRPFRPHLTLGRIRSTQNKQNLIKKIRDIEHINIGAFEVNEVVIFQSKLSRAGPTYVEHSKFRLGG